MRSPDRSWQFCFWLLSGLRQFLSRLADCVDYRDFIHWVGSFATSGAARDVAISGSHAYVLTDLGDRPGLDVINIGMSTTYPPKILGSVDLDELHGSGGSVTASGAFAYLTTGEHCQGGTFGVVDATDPEHPELVGELTMPGDPSAVAVSGTYAYVAQGCHFQGLEVIDVSDPRHPRSVGAVTTPGYAQAVAVSGSRAYVTALDWHYPYTDSLQVIDLSDPERPAILGAVLMPQPGNYYNVGPVAVSGDFAYVAAADKWVYAVDVSDPVDPHVVGSVNVGGEAHAMSVSGKYLYATGTSNHYASRAFLALDLSDPRPRCRRKRGSGELRAGGFANAGGFAYVAGCRVHMIAISNPNSPPIVGGVDTPGKPATSRSPARTPTSRTTTEGSRSSTSRIRAPHRS